MTRQYDRAQTPFRRLLNSPSVSAEIKVELRRQYATLDPVALLSELQRLEDGLWKYAWRSRKCALADEGSQANTSEAIFFLNIPETKTIEDKEIIFVRPSSAKKNCGARSNVPPREPSAPRQYRSTRQPRKAPDPHTWRTRLDPFEGAEQDIYKCFQKDNQITALQLLTILQKEYPGRFSDGQCRTLRRRLNKLRSVGAGEPITPPLRQTYPKHYVRQKKTKT